ncbi:MAG: signal recognition particle-docking protein FtsY [Myxococcota bacterium]|nr:signal recognition particle-docking protein FtsY [Myxococcota bacterium]
MDFLSFIAPVGEWVGAHPLAAVVIAAVFPILLTLVAELLPRRARPPEPEALEAAAAQPAAPEVAAPAAEPAPLVAPEPVAEPEPVPLAPEPVPVAPEPAPVTPEVAPVTPEVAPVTPEVAPVTPEVAPVTPEVAPPPRARLRDRLKLTHDALVGRLGSVLSGRSVDAELLDDLEMLLMSADLGVKTADGLLETVRRQAAGADGDTVRRLLRDAVAEKLRRVQPEPGGGLALSGKPHVILVLGVNGSGKTTTIGKLAARHIAEGRKVVLGAGDTFRAAAIEQLQTWGERAGCEVIAGQAGGDPSAVAFDTVKAAIARGADVAIIDTAGRLQTKKPLMEELGKLSRVIGKSLEGAPHETLLVLDSNTGQNAISQAQLFTEVAGVTGLVLTKLDGTAKGGVIVGLADEFGIPVKHVGVGEAVEDLRDFDAEEFVDAVFS